MNFLFCQEDFYEEFETLKRRLWKRATLFMGPTLGNLEGVRLPGLWGDK